MNSEEFSNHILQLILQGKAFNDNNNESSDSLFEKICFERNQLIMNNKIPNNPYSNIYQKDNQFYEEYNHDEPQCITDEIPFNIPNNWKWVRFESVVDFTIGKTPQRKNPEFWNSKDVPWISISDFKDKYINYTKEKISKKALKNSFKNKIVPKDTLLMSFKLTIGKTAILGMDAVHNEAIISIHPFFDQDNIFRDYLYWILPIMSKMGDIKPTLKGNTLNSTSINKLLIPLPPFKEQKRINELMNVIHKYISSHEKLNELNNYFFTEFKKLVLKNAFRGKLAIKNSNNESANILLKKIYSERDKLIENGDIKNKNYSIIYKNNNKIYEKKRYNDTTICINDEIPFDIPHSWEWARLDTLVYNFGQKIPDKKFTYIELKSIDNKNFKLKNNEKILNEKEAPSRARKIVKNGSIIFSTTRPYLLNMCIINREFEYEPIVSTAFAVLNTIDGIFNEYLFYYLQSPYFLNYVTSHMTGSSPPTINNKNFYKTLVPIPPLEEQINIVNQIKKLLSNAKYLKNK